MENVRGGSERYCSSATLAGQSRAVIEIDRITLYVAA